MSSRSAETVLCLNTANRDISIYPEPNDFVLELKDRLEVQMAALGSIELPHSQLLIEPAWNTFAFDVGLSFPSHVQRTFRAAYEASGIVSTRTVLPAPHASCELLRINAETLVWKTTANHGIFNGTIPLLAPHVCLPSNGLWEANQRLSLVEVMDDGKTFSTELPSLPYVPTVGRRACLVVNTSGPRSFATPSQLVEVLNSVFRDMSMNDYPPLTFSYDKVEMRLGARLPPGLRVISDAEASLIQTLGLVQRPGSYEWTAERFPLASSQPVRIPVGNYDKDLFKHVAELRMNPLLACGSTPKRSSSSGALLAHVTFWGSATMTVTFPDIATYHPRGLALRLSETIAATSVSMGLPKIVVTFVNDAFVFASDPPVPFVMVWNDPDTTAEMTARLGVDLTYGFVTRITGAPRNFFDVPSAVSLPTSAGGISITMEKQFAVQAIPRVQVAAMPDPGATTVRFSGSSVGVARVGAVPLEYVVQVGVGSAAHFAVATHVLEDFTYIQLLEEDVTLSGDLPICIVRAHPTSAVNMYFHGKSWNRLAEIWGFDGGANLWSHPLLRAPRMWTFDQPSYLLLEFGFQRMSANITHRCLEDVRVIFGKLLLYPPFKMERMTPMQKVATGVTMITNLHVKILNPWHQPYNFHGRNWSMTLVIASAARPVQALCP